MPRQASRAAALPAGAKPPPVAALGPRPRAGRLQVEPSLLLSRKDGALVELQSSSRRCCRRASRRASPIHWRLLGGHVAGSTASSGWRAGEENCLNLMACGRNRAATGRRRRFLASRGRTRASDAKIAGPPRRRAFRRGQLPPSTRRCRHDLERRSGHRRHSSAGRLRHEVLQARPKSAACHQAMKSAWRRSVIKQNRPQAAAARSNRSLPPSEVAISTAGRRRPRRSRRASSTASPRPPRPHFQCGC